MEFKCTFRNCSFINDEIEEIVKHVNQIHCLDRENSNMPCVYKDCKFRYRRAYFFIKHIQTNHMDDSNIPIKCPNKCAFIFRDCWRFKVHFENHHIDSNEYLSEADKVDYSCFVRGCDFKTMKKKDYQSHYLSCHTNKLIKFKEEYLVGNTTTHQCLSIENEIIASNERYMMKDIHSFYSRYRTNMPKKEMDNKIKRLNSLLIINNNLILNSIKEIKDIYIENDQKEDECRALLSIKHQIDSNHAQK
jgi:hypothetical protein